MNKQEIINKTTKEFFKHIGKKMPQTQALTLSLEHNIPNASNSTPQAISEQTEQTKMKFDKLIELQILKNQKEELRHKHIMEEIKELSKAEIKIYVRGDYMNDFDPIKQEMQQETKKAKLTVAKRSRVKAGKKYAFENKSEVNSPAVVEKLDEMPDYETATQDTNIHERIAEEMKKDYEEGNVEDYR